jgi:hypothetical protein
MNDLYRALLTLVGLLLGAGAFLLVITSLGFLKSIMVVAALMLSCIFVIVGTCS